MKIHKYNEEMQEFYTQLEKTTALMRPLFTNIEGTQVMPVLLILLLILQEFRSYITHGDELTISILLNLSEKLRLLQKLFI